MITTEVRNYPMSPSANALYRNLPMKGRVKTDKYTEFELKVMQWKAVHGHQVNAMHLFSDQVKRDRLVLDVAAEFMFNRATVLSKEGLPKKLDVENRLKAAIDTLMKIMDLDDSIIWSGSYSKGVMVSSSFEHINFKIQGFQREVPRGTI